MKTGNSVVSNTLAILRLSDAVPGSDVIVSAVVSGISEDSVDSGTVVSLAVVFLIVVSSVVESLIVESM